MYQLKPYMPGIRLSWQSRLWSVMRFLGFITLIICTAIAGMCAVAAFVVFLTYYTFEWMSGEWTSGQALYWSVIGLAGAVALNALLTPAAE